MIEKKTSNPEVVTLKRDASDWLTIWLTILAVVLCPVLLIGMLLVCAHIARQATGQTAK